MTNRTKALLGGAATVVVIAAVILGMWAFGSPRKTVPTITLSPQQRSVQALQQGLDALSKDQTQTAIQLFETALTADPTNAEAQKALSDAKNGVSDKPKPKPSTNPTKTPAPASAWEGDIDVSSLLPSTFADYHMGALQLADTTAVISASPILQTATVSSVVWTVYDRGSKTSAADFIKKTSKTLYTKDNATVAVNDVSNAFFGTDGKQLATVTFTRGRYVFEVIVTSTKQPSAEKAFAQKAAAAFAVSP